MWLMELIEADAVKKENGKTIINNLEVHSDKEGVDIYIGWHTPCFNDGYYPIVQVDDDEGNMVLHKEGPENSSDWYGWIEETLKNYLSSDDWWHIR